MIIPSTAKLGQTVLLAIQEEGIDGFRMEAATVQAFTENTEVRGRHIVCPSEFWKPELLFDSPVLAFQNVDDFAAALEVRGDKSPTGKWVYANTLLNTAMQAFRVDDFAPGSVTQTRGAVYFTGPVVIPVLYGPERNEAGHRIPWMSYIPSELVTQRSQLRHAQGRVVVGGYGMGWFTKRVMQRPEVTEVVVVERCQELMDWYGYEQIERTRKDLADQGRNVKVTVEVCDLFRYMDGCSRVNLSTVFLLDIWPMFTDAMMDGRLIRQLLRGLNIHAWGLPDPARENPFVWARFMLSLPRDGEGYLRLDYREELKGLV